MRASEEYDLINQFTAQAPVNIRGLINALGLQYREAFLADDISGMLERLGEDKFRVTVNANHSKTRQRFTAAHELGHYMNHRNLIGEGIDDNKAYRSTEGGKYHNKNIGPIEETEANKFAAIALMPKSQVRLAYDGEQDPTFLADKFGVSEMAMKWRLVNLKLATKRDMGLR